MGRISVYDLFRISTPLGGSLTVNLTLNNPASVYVSHMKKQRNLQLRILPMIQKDYLKISMNLLLKQDVLCCLCTL